MNPLLFTDPAFLFFFAPIVLTGYWIAPVSWRNGFLLIASMLLYAWGEGRYVAVLAGSIAINWTFGLSIARCERPRLRRLVLVIGVASNIGLLALFKYAPFFILNLDLLLNRLGIPRLEPTHLRLPIGLSFYTFMGISYLVDIFRRDLEKPSSLARVALFMTMFPHLIAGPIVRMTEIGSQLGHRFWNSEGVAAGIRRFVIGLGKKMLIANTLATAADAIFALPPQQIPASHAWLALVCYTLQIYFDFSGYSDMAIGLARMLGFQFPENFNYPYVAQSVTDFWRRWHMTLSAWLRDYLFFPLGVRGGRLQTIRNLFIVFFLCGLWHGAAYNFIVWGLWYGVLLSVEQLGLAKGLRMIPAPFRIAYTLAAVMCGWILFRSPTLHYALGFSKALLGFGGGALPRDWIATQFINPATYVAIAAGVVAAIPLKSFFAGAAPHWTPAARIAEFAALSCVFIAVLATAAGDTYNPFIYFRF